MSAPKICILEKESLLKKSDKEVKELSFILKTINDFTDNYVVVLDENNNPKVYDRKDKESLEN